jgi:hypothetical protein
MNILINKITNLKFKEISIIINNKLFTDDKNFLISGRIDHYLMGKVCMTSAQKFQFYKDAVVELYVFIAQLPKLN